MSLCEMFFCTSTFLTKNYVSRISVPCGLVGIEKKKTGPSHHNTIYGVISSPYDFIKCHDK